MRNVMSNHGGLNDNCGFGLSEEQTSDKSRKINSG